MKVLELKDTFLRAEEKGILELLANILYNEYIKKVGVYLTNSFQRNIRYLYT